MKTGILTYHYSNNYGGVLQSYALYRLLETMSVNVDIIDFVPLSYRVDSLLYNIVRTIGLRKNVFKMDIRDISPGTILHRVAAKAKYNKSIGAKFDDFREIYLPNRSTRVNEQTVEMALRAYDRIIVGSDQIWGPSERKKPVYFVDFDSYSGIRISYAADSTLSEVDKDQVKHLGDALTKFNHISVRNEHSQDFVNYVIQKKPQIVVDPTLLWSFDELGRVKATGHEPYILVYVLGEDINGSNEKAIEKIKLMYGNMKVYAVSIPTMKFNICDYADKVFYDLGPEEWLNLIRNASFVYTDSFHGTLFSLKFRRPFLAYYAEEMRATRFIDLGQRYQIEKYIVSSVEEIDTKKSLQEPPDFDFVNSLIDEHKKESIRFLEKALGINKQGSYEHEG